MLERLKSGELDASYCKKFIRFAQRSSNLSRRLKQDSIEVAGMRVSIWSLFAESEYIQRLVKSGMKKEEKILLEGNVASSFFLLYELWNGKKIDFNALSGNQLIGILQGANFFQAIVKN